MTTSYWLACTKCGTELLHGMQPPARPAQSCTARDIRMNCRRNGCDPQLRTKDTPLAPLDQIRLGLVDEQQAWAQMRVAK
jgi:hypothetical protein